MNFEAAFENTLSSEKLSDSEFFAFPSTLRSPIVLIMTSPVYASSSITPWTLPMRYLNCTPFSRLGKHASDQLLQLYVDRLHQSDHSTFMYSLLQQSDSAFIMLTDFDYGLSIP